MPVCFQSLQSSEPLSLSHLHRASASTPTHPLTLSPLTLTHSHAPSWLSVHYILLLLEALLLFFPPNLSYCLYNSFPSSSWCHRPFLWHHPPCPTPSIPSLSLFLPPSRYVPSASLYLALPHIPLSFLSLFLFLVSPFFISHYSRNTLHLETGCHGNNCTKVSAALQAKLCLHSIAKPGEIGSGRERLKQNGEKK